MVVFRSFIWNYKIINIRTKWKYNAKALIYCFLWSLTVWVSAPFSSSPAPVPAPRIAAGAVFGADLGAAAERCGAEHQQDTHHLVIHVNQPRG